MNVSNVWEVPKNEFVDRRRYMDTLLIVMDKFPYLAVGVSRTGSDMAIPP